jgi:hypothetical protein
VVAAPLAVIGSCEPTRSIAAEPVADAEPVDAITNVAVTFAEPVVAAEPVAVNGLCTSNEALPVVDVEPVDVIGCATTAGA